MEKNDCRTQANRWAIVLAGGDGVRLRPLTRRISGDERPKQFCPIVGGETLLDRTLRRTRLTIADENTLVVVTQKHEPFYKRYAEKMPSHSFIVQPDNRGTTAPILYGLLRAVAMDPGCSVATFPSDHYVSDDESFMYYVDAAFEAARVMPESVLLLGINAKSPEVEYGWIEPADPIFLPCAGPLFRVDRFWEKPSITVAQRLLSRGCFWNSFVMVGRAKTLLELISESTPDVYSLFERIAPAIGTSYEAAAIGALYSQLRESNFSQEILTRQFLRLAVLPVTGMEWSDWGDPARVLGSLARIGVQPEWAAMSLAASA
jgi:mannose-1-phosphate guanylyltransferase